MKQDGEEWLAWRRAGIGGSDAPVVVGVSPWKTRYQLYCDKRGEGGDDVVTGPMQRGKDLEPEARAAYEAATGHIVEPTTMEHREWPVMRASLDGLSWDGTHALELKCPGLATHEEIVGAQAVPKHYWPQVQHLLAVSGAKTLDFVSYHPDAQIPLIIVECVPDAAYITDLIETERRFWDQVQGVTPPPEAPPQPEQRLDTNWQETALLYREAEAGMAEWESKRKACRERLIALMGQSTRATGGGLSVTKLSKTVTNFAQACKDVGLDVAKYQTTREEWRVTLAKEK